MHHTFMTEPAFSRTSSSSSLESVLSVCTFDSPVHQRVMLDADMRPRRTVSLEGPVDVGSPPPSRGRRRRRRVQFDLNRTTVHTIPARPHSNNAHIDEDRDSQIDRSGSSDDYDGELETTNQAENDDGDDNGDSHRSETDDGCDHADHPTAHCVRTGALVEEALRCIRDEPCVLPPSSTTRFMNQRRRRRYRRKGHSSSTSHFAFPPVHDAAGSKDDLALDQGFQAWLGANDGDNVSMNNQGGLRLARFGGGMEEYGGRSISDGDLNYDNVGLGYHSASSSSSSSSQEQGRAKDLPASHNAAQPLPFGSLQFPCLDDEVLNGGKGSDDSNVRDLPPLQPKPTHEYRNRFVQLDEATGPQKLRCKRLPQGGDFHFGVDHGNSDTDADSQTKLSPNSLMSFLVPPVAPKRDMAPLPPRRRRSSSSQD